MKKIILILSLLISSYASAVEIDVHPVAAVGYRFGRYQFFDGWGPGAFYMSGRVTTIGHQLCPDAYANFLSPSISYQTDGKFGYGFSPVSITTPEGITASFDIIFARKDVNGDIVGISVGLKF